MGSYLFANQYQNEVIPDDEKSFKAHWIHYFKVLPEIKNTFAFIDPAIGQKEHNDFTGIVVVDVDCDANWYVRLAQRYRITPTEIVDKMFQIQAQFKPSSIGIEIVAYQEALLYILDEKMKREQKILPVVGVTRNKVSKQSRILGLVPRFEWGKCFMAQGMTDFEDEYSSFPRGGHDDLLDSLASIENIVHYPQRKVHKLEQPNSQSDPNYEKWYISQIAKQQEERY